MFIIFNIHQIKLRTCVQGEGGQGHCVRIAYTGGGGGGQKLAKLCVRTLWMVPCLDGGLYRALDVRPEGNLDGGLDGALDSSLDGGFDSALDGTLGGTLDGVLDCRLGGGCDFGFDGWLDDALGGALDGTLDDALDKWTWWWLW